MAAYKVHYLLSANIEVMEWLMLLDRAFMDGYGLMPDPMNDVEEDFAAMKAGLPIKPFTVCFETDDKNLAIMFKLRFSDSIIEWTDA